MPSTFYMAQVEQPADDAVVACGNCDWEGPYSDGDDIRSAILTPGDPSPACRCPECGVLAYLKEKAE